MTALAISIPAPAPILAIPTPEDVLSALTAAGIRVFVFLGELGFGLEYCVDWDLAVPAWEALKRLPGGHEALKRHIMAPNCFAMME